MVKNLIAMLLTLPMLSFGQLEMDFDEDYASAASAWSPMILIPDVWYKGESNPNDSSVNLNNGTWIGSPAYDTGKNGTAFSFGITNYAITNKTYAFRTGTESLTVCAWIKIPNVTGDKCAVSWGNTHWLLSINSNVAKFYNNRGNSWIYSTNSILVSSNVWIHLAGVYNGTNLNCYVNSIAGVATMSSAAWSTPDDNRFLSVGAYNGTWKSSSIIDDVFVFNRALTPDEIIKIYNWRQ